MHTTRVITQEFDYVAPSSLHDALGLLGEGVKILAGGTDLLVKMKHGPFAPFNLLLDTKNIKELDFLNKSDKGLEIGALTTLTALEKSAEVKAYPALFDAVPLMASVGVRNMGTLGGNIGNASPAADTVCPMIVHNGTVRLASGNGDRDVALRDFFKGPGITVMNPDEIIVSVQLEAPAANSGSAFRKMTRVKPDISKVSATAYIERDGATVKECRIAMGSVAATPLTLADVAQQAVGKTASKELFKEIAAKVSDAIKPIDDNRSTAEYRKQIAHVIVAEVLETAWTRAGGSL